MSKAPAQTRLIDRDNAVRTTEMKVLNLGLSRTGTLSMYTALNRLGIRSYHMLEAIQNTPRDLILWREAIALKTLHTGNIHHQLPPPSSSSPPPHPPLYTRPDFDKLLGSYAATADIPMALLGADLVSAYPSALVVLTVRSPRSFARSIAATAGTVLHWRSWRLLRHLDPTFVGPWMALADALGAYLGVPDWRDEEGLVAAYEAHVAEVRRVVPEERLLVFGAVEAGGCGWGWGPLCGFLGVGVPEGEEEGGFPWVNETEGFVEVHLEMRNAAVKRVVGRLAGPVVGVVVAGVAWWLWRAR